MSQSPPARDIARIVLVVLFIGLMIVSSLWILQPFLGALVWATMIVVATWPLMLKVQDALGGRRWAAVTVMTLAMLFLLVAPLTIAILTVIDRRDEIVTLVASLSTADVPPPPAWLEQRAIRRGAAAEEWRRLAAIGAEELTAQAAPYIRQALTWFAGQAGSLGLMVLHFLLTLVSTAILYANGEAAASGVRRFGRRLADERGENAVVLSGQAIRAVALGVVVTAIAQSAVAGLGLARRRDPLRRGADNGDSGALHRADRSHPRPRAGRGVALLVGRFVLGHGAARVDRGRRHAR